MERESDERESDINIPVEFDVDHVFIVYSTILNDKKTVYGLCIVCVYKC